MNTTFEIPAMSCGHCVHGVREALERVEGVEVHRMFGQPAVDPTGCGDAFRGGLLFGLENNMDWETTGRLASLMGSIKITHQGPQNHQMSKDEIAAQFKSAFGFTF